MARPSRIVLILGFAVLAPAASGAAASAAGISLASGARVVSAAGRIGPLRVDRSRAGAIRRYAGTPMFAGSGRPGSGMGLRSFKALGYRCAPRRADGRGINPGGVRKTHVWCRTVFFLNARTGRLAGFWTDSPIFRTAKAIRPEMRQATAGPVCPCPRLRPCPDRHLRRHAHSELVHREHRLQTQDSRRQPGNDPVCRGLRQIADRRRSPPGRVAGRRLPELGALIGGGALAGVQRSGMIPERRGQG